MLILSHRGWWVQPGQKNTKWAFTRSFENGFGTETDIRDFNGRLVVSHDVPRSGELPLEEFFQVYLEHGGGLPLALNIKSDGLQKDLMDLVLQFRIQDFFVFDMSVPDTLGYARNHIPYFTRQSEFESPPVFYDSASGVWLDQFHGPWFDGGVVQSHLDKGKKVCIVSPELHEREFLHEWARYRDWDRKYNGGNRFMICTDHPDRARQFFKA